VFVAKQEEIQRFLEELRAAVPELKGVLVALNEGLPVSHSFANGADPQRVAAMAAAASSIGRRISDSLGNGTLAEISVMGSDGQIFVYSAGAKAVLAVIAPTGANAGLIHLEARQTASGIGQLF
jgi:predicted regulator of Ras-like GTPase activity (Roadblock/LC7/MglB family)